MRATVDLSNPIVAFMAVWSITAALFWLQLYDFYVELDGVTASLVAANMISVTVAYWMLTPRSVAKQKVRLSLDYFDLYVLRKFIRWGLVICGLGIAINISFSGALPLVKLLSGDPGENVRQYGLPTFSGLIAAVQYFVATAIWLDYCVSGHRRYLPVLLVFFGWSVGTLSRGGFTWLALQTAAVYLLVNRVSVKTLLSSLMGMVAFIWAFGAVGDLRSLERAETESLRRAVQTDLAHFSNAMPSGLIWTYAYMTSGINNLAANVGIVSPTMTPYWSLQTLLPTVLRPYFYEERVYPLELASEAFTMGTFYASYLADFGIVGAFFAATIAQLITCRFYWMARAGSIGAILGYAVFWQCTVLSVYNDNFTTWVAMFQILLCIFLNIVLKRQRLRLVEAAARASATRKHRNLRENAV